MRFLKQSTSQTIMFGPFVDKTDGVTLKTDATTITDIDHATTGIFLSKNGGTAAIRYQTSKVASVADAYGMMNVTLLATDTNTVGRLDVLFAKAATYLPVHASYTVLPANVYDAFLGTDLLDVSATQFAGQTITAGAGVTIRADVGAAAAPGSANGMLIGGSNAATTFASATVTDLLTIGNGVSIAATTAGRPGIQVTGNTTGAGILATGGNAAAGISAVGIGTGGHGISAVSGTTATTAGIYAAGGATNATNGMRIAGGSTSGVALVVASTSGAGATIDAGTAGPGLKVTGVAAGGHGIQAVSGTTAATAGIAAQGGATNATLGMLVSGGTTSGAGLSVTTTSGDGISVAPTAGHAMTLQGNGTTKHGLNALGGATTSNGILATGGGAGAGLAVTGPATVSGTTTLAALTVTGATTHTGTTTYTGAVLYSDAITATAGPVTLTNASNDIKGVFAATNGIVAASIATGAITNAKFAAGAIDAAAIANGAIDNATFAADVGSTAYATNIIALAADKAIVNAALGTAAELAKVPKSDSTVSFNATALGAIADAVLDEDMTAHQTQGTLGQAIGDPGADANTIFKAVVTDATGATVGVDVVAVKAETVDILTDTAVIGALGAGLTALATQTSVNDLPTNAELATALGTADDAVLAAIAALNNVSAAQVNAEVVDALATDTYAESAGVPAATASLAEKIRWIATLSRNKITQTATTQLVKADDGSTTIGTSTVSDDATTATRGEFA